MFLFPVFSLSIRFLLSGDLFVISFFFFFGLIRLLSSPLLFPFFQFILLNSTWKTLRQGGIRWRETFYPLETLRSGNVR